MPLFTSAVRDLFTRVLGCPSNVAVGDLVYVSAADTVDQAHADSAGAWNNVLGFVFEKPTTTTCIVQIAGDNDQLDGLTAGVSYYLSNTPGVLTDTPGTVTVLVGTALDATTLTMVPGGTGLGQAGGGGSSPFIAGYGMNSAVLANQNNYAYGVGAVAEGYQTTARSDHSHTEGSGTYASNFGTHAEGSGTVAGGTYAHAEGAATYATGNISHAEGHNTNATGNNAHAEGYQTYAGGQSSHAEGFNSQATGYGAHAEGQSTSGGKFTHSEGIGTDAQGDYSHAEGGFSYAHGKYSHASGYGAFARNTAEWALGANTTQTFDDISFFNAQLQTSVVVATVLTTDATPTDLTILGDMILMDPVLALCWIDVVAHQYLLAPGAPCAAWTRRCLVQYDVFANTLAIVGSIDTIGTDLGSNGGAPPAGWGVAVSGDIVNGALKVTVTGAAATDIVWAASVRMTQAGI